MFLGVHFHGGIGPRLAMQVSLVTPEREAGHEFEGVFVRLDPMPPDRAHRKLSEAMSHKPVPRGVAFFSPKCTVYQSIFCVV